MKYARFCKAIAITFSVGLALVFSSCATGPTTAYVQDLDLPDYNTREHRIDYPIDLFIEPRIPVLRARVVPRGETRVYPDVTIIAGPALERALMTLTRSHFSKAHPVELVDRKPTLVYRLLTFKPSISVVPGAVRTQLEVSARLALQVNLQSASGEILYSSTAIGTSHVSDTKLSPGSRLTGYAPLMEVVTRNAIIDAMYEMSKNFGDNDRAVNTNMRADTSLADAQMQSFDDVIMYLRTAPVEWN